MNTTTTLRKFLPLATTLAAGLLFAGSASAQSFRCKNDLVSVGDARAAVLLKCGEPVVRDTHCKRPDPAHPVVPALRPDGTPVRVVSCEHVDEWTYNPGYGQFMTTLRFEHGKLAAITYGDRVATQVR
jgi:Protein of unknown function (DUF2845)